MNLSLEQKFKLAGFTAILNWKWTVNLRLCLGNLSLRNTACEIFNFVVVAQENYSVLGLLNESEQLCMPAKLLGTERSF